MVAGFFLIGILSWTALDHIITAIVTLKEPLNSYVETLLHSLKHGAKQFRATVYGAIVIMPKPGTPIPFPQTHGPFMDAPLTTDSSAATAILQYKGIPNTVPTLLPQPPAPNDTAFALNYNAKHRSLKSPQFPANAPLKVDMNLFYTFVGLLQAHYFNVEGVFRLDFPDNPPTPFNYTGAPLAANLGTTVGNRLSKIAYNSTVQLDPAKFNLVNPQERNTVGLPIGGWTAIRFREDSPGLWFMHCHSELHTGWGLKQHLSSRMDKAQISLSSLHLKTSLPASIQNQPSQFGMFEKDG
ncbi:hypothetical protein POTOM_034760 [Populus tomentosa]|uniref:Plastocyanin-like domain-containing protein n=1 Tax=Populus tomentosa TaxID=118781 RepID=A0A8X7YZA0_POPTO|nr:hypothetical protein POTOM_034760 [Populus tomentosa]